MQRSPVRAAELDPQQRPSLRRYGNWKRFARRLRHSGRPLLGALGRYTDAVLVAGCQRSGTTMLTQLIAGADGFRGLALTRDDELDAALALIGEITLPAGSRYCFQTTYLNERYPEYAGIGPGHKLIWVVRNPYSVVYSMVYNWRRFALNELYESCGVKQGLESGAAWWTRGPSSIEKACRAYAGKAGQLESIVAMIDPGQLLVVDYDQLVRSPREHLAAIFDFAGAPFEPGYAARVRPDSLGKAKGMSAGAVAMIEKWATPVHSRCLSLVSLPKAA